MSAALQLTVITTGEYQLRTIRAAVAGPLPQNSTLLTHVIIHPRLPNVANTV